MLFKGLNLAILGVTFKQSTEGYSYCYSIEDTIKDADICFMFTKWNEVKIFDLIKYNELMRNPIVLDGRNCHDLINVKNANITYDSIGGETFNIFWSFDYLDFKHSLIEKM